MSKTLRALSAPLSKLRNAAFFLAGRGVSFSPQAWDDQYREQHWSYLNGSSERARYEAIAGCVQALDSKAAILDVGCGEGILGRILSPGSHSRYVGVDVSGVAIDLARAKADARSSFHHADAESWNPSERFDVIVFNESLYHFHDPVSALRKYEMALNPGGVFIVCMYSTGGHTSRLWADVLRAYRCSSATRLQQGALRSCSVRVLAPSHSTPARDEA